MIKVAITDYTFASLDIETAILRHLGCELVASKGIPPLEELAQLVGDADHVLTQFAPINAGILAAMKKAKVIVRYGVGVDNIDLDAARAVGIPVCNVPDYCVDEVADHTLALLLATTRQLIVHWKHVQGGNWGLPVPLTAMKALSDLTAGVLGFGRIGREVARRLLAFKCPVLVHDPAVSETVIRESRCEPAGFEELLRRSDVVSLHCPLTAQTRRLIRAETLAHMKPGAILVNAGRGGLVDSADLVNALRSGQLAGAGLDVFDPEPIPANCPLLNMDNVVISPHAASVSAKAVRRLRETAAGIIAQAIRGEPVPNIVNL